MTAQYKKIQKIENKDRSSKVQRVLNKLISEEWLAGQLYFLFNSAVNVFQENMVKEMFDQTAKDEIDDHYKNLVIWAKCNGYDVPVSIKDMVRYADERVVKQFESIKKGKDAVEYIEESVKAELYAIESYVEVMKADDDTKNPEYVSLMQIIQNNYYDELQHYQDFMFMLTSIKTMIDKVVQ